MFGFLAGFRKKKPQERLKKLILVVEDEANIALLLKEILERKGGYDALVANDGKAGLEMAHTLEPDLILLDIKLPRMNGFEVLKKLKEGKKTFSIPVIMVSGNTDEESKLRVAYLHSDDYITKPFEAEALLTKVKSRLGS